MSTHPLKSKLSGKRAKSHKQRITSPAEQQGKKKIVIFALIAILAAIPFGLGKYIEFNSPGPFDSGANVYSAKHILDGAKIGVEEKHSASAGTLLVNIAGVWLFGFNDIGPKFMQMLFQAAALVLMFMAMRKLFGGMLPAAVGVIVTSVYLSAPLIAKHGNDKMQFATAFMIIGVSCFVLYQLGGRWWYALFSGGFLVWALLFKPTAASAIGAIGLFVILQPVFKNRTLKQTGGDILLLLAGAVVAIAPLYLWIIGWDVQMGLPFLFVWRAVQKVLLAVVGGGEQTKAVSEYVVGSRKLVSFSQQWPVVLRFYTLLILPIALAVGAIVAKITRMICKAVSAAKIKPTSYDHYVLLFAVWWLLDTAFVWISPRSYEQYYLPLNASAAMLGGYVIALYSDKFYASVYKGKWGLIGAAGLVCMIIMSWHIFFGIEKSPYTGREYGSKRKGYAQRLSEISQRRKHNLIGPWEAVGRYIRHNSEPTDKIYVWGWYAGIYVKAQRFSAAAKAFMMPRPAPEIMAEKITGLLAEFEQERPKFIVDPRKRHIPTERPPYELWPIMPKGLLGVKKPTFLPLDEDTIAAYDKLWFEHLRDNFDEDEALRFKALKPFREFVMKNYQIVRTFGQHVLFKLKD